jgi:hypothetical protein
MHTPNGSILTWTRIHTSDMITHRYKWHEHALIRTMKTYIHAYAGRFCPGACPVCACWPQQNSEPSHKARLDLRGGSSSWSQWSGRQMTIINWLGLGPGARARATARDTATATAKGSCTDSVTVTVGHGKFKLRRGNTSTIPKESISKTKNKQKKVNKKQDTILVQQDFFFPRVDRKQLHCFQKIRSTSEGKFGQFILRNLTHYWWFVCQRWSLLVVVNVKKSTLGANMRHCTVMNRCSVSDYFANASRPTWEVYPLGNVFDLGQVRSIGYLFWHSHCTCTFTCTCIIQHRSMLKNMNHHDHVFTSSLPWLTFAALFKIHFFFYFSILQGDQHLPSPRVNCWFHKKHT